MNQNEGCAELLASSGGVELCPREVTSAGRAFSSLAWPRLYGSNSRKRRWFWPNAARYEWEGDLY
jgi:hypothetical protein